VILEQTDHGQRRTDYILEVIRDTFRLFCRSGVDWREKRKRS